MSEIIEEEERFPLTFNMVFNKEKGLFVHYKKDS